MDGNICRELKMCEFQKKHFSNMSLEDQTRNGTISKPHVAGQFSRRLQYSSPSASSKDALSSRVSTLSSLSSSSDNFNLRLLSRLLLLFVIAVGSQASSPSEQTELETDTVDKYLSTFGYYPSHARENEMADANDKDGSLAEAAKHTDTERHQAIERLQTFFHLPVSGELDSGTKKMMKTARCGREDIIQDDGKERKNSREGARAAGNRRRKRYSVGKYGDGTIAKWNPKEMSWRVTLPSRQLSEPQQREIIRKSLDMWARYVPIKFVEDRSQNEPDINIKWVRRQHGPSTDPVFDGKPEGINVLAHAWGPGHDPKNLAGDVHFDEDDDWKNYNALLGVAVHELGHVMGLGHSTDDTSIMYPVYRADVIELGQDDINGIKEVYGSGGGLRPVNPMTRTPNVWTYRPETRTRGPSYTVHPQITTPAMDVCLTVNIDAVFEDPAAKIGPIYIAVSDENVHTLTQHGVLIKSEPLKSVYPEVPVNPDVAFSIYSRGTVYFIKDNTMWAYREGQLELGYPRSLSSLQFPERPRFAVSLSQRGDNSGLLLFGDQYWWRFDVDRSSAISYRPIADFSGELPRGVRFAAQWIDNNLYAVTQDSYVIMDLGRRRIIHEAPIPGKPEWLQALCGHASKASISMASLVTFAFLASVLKSILL